MLLKNLLAVLIFVPAILCSSSAFAGSYWGIGLGSASWNLVPYYSAYELKNGPAIDAFFGLRNGPFGIEGELTASSHDWVDFPSATHHDANLIIAGMGYLPIGQYFDLYGKLGFDYWHTTVDFLGGTFDGDSGISLLYGVGMNFGLSPTMGLRLEYKQMNDIGDGLDKGDLSVTTLSLVFRL